MSKETKQLPSKFVELNNQCKDKVEGLEREKEHTASEYIPKMYNVLREDGYLISEARMTVEEHAGKYLSYWSIIRNLPDEAKHPGHVIGGKASAEAREKRKLDRESKMTYPHRIVLEKKEVVDRIFKDMMQLILDKVTRMEIVEVAPGDVRIQGPETIKAIS